MRIDIKLEKPQMLTAHNYVARPAKGEVTLSEDDDG